jgi:hypothetical protein
MFIVKIVAMIIVKFYLEVVRIYVRKIVENVEPAWSFVNMEC